MYKVFINEKPLFFLQNPDELTVSEGTKQLAFSDCKSLDQLLTIHASGEATVITGKAEQWLEFTELFTVIEAAGGLVENSEGEFLFIFRNGKWDLPKGKLESGESPAPAAVREVEEECGISNPVIVNSLGETYHTYFHKGNWVLKRTYWYKMGYVGAEKLIPQTEEGITEVQWIRPEGWSKVLRNTYGSIQDVLNQYTANL